jgi:hypothetical protein
MLRMFIPSIDVIKVWRKPFPFTRTRINAHMVHITLRTIEEDA